MPNLTAFVLKPLLLLFEAKLESKITGGLLHKKSKKLEYFVLGDEYKQVVAPKKIEYSGEDANVLINDLCIKQFADIDCSHYTLAPLGQEVFTTDGKLLGTVSDLELDDEFICTALLINKERISTSKIITFGDNIVLTKGKRSPKIVKYISKKIKYPKNDDISVKILDEEYDDDSSSEFEDNYPVTEPISLAQAIKSERLKQSLVLENDNIPINVQAQSFENSADNDESPPAIDNSNQSSTEVNNNTAQNELNITPENRVTQGTRKFALNEMHNPFRIISNYSFLLGRLVTKTIFSFNRELIVKEGEVITTPVVERARHAGKLVELTLNSKK
ncbi:MAG TPA: hypothetical protein VJZ69_01045 [Clostridia bacterium]|nr:hypothetical protein [Clostridia bacterium]